MTDIHTQTLRLPNELRQAVDRFWHQNELPNRHSTILRLVRLGLSAADGPSETLADDDPYPGEREP